MYLLINFFKSISFVIHIFLVISLFLSILYHLLFDFILIYHFFTDNTSFSLGNFANRVFSLFILFVFFNVIKSALYAVWINPFFKSKKENFLSKYTFPPKLYLMLERKFSHLEKNEIEEIVSLLRDYFKFRLNRKDSEENTLPSLSVEFAYKSFMVLEEYEPFLKKLFGTRIAPSFSLKNHKHGLTTLAIENQDLSTIELWCYFSQQENLDPYFPARLPNFFQIDERLKIPSRLSYTFDEYKLIPLIPLSYAPSPYMLEKEITEMTNLLRVAKKIQHLLGKYEYCKQYERKEIESLFALIDNNELLSRAVYGKYGNNNLKEYALRNAKVVENIGCSSGASL